MVINTKQMYSFFFFLIYEKIIIKQILEPISLLEKNFNAYSHVNFSSKKEKEKIKCLTTFY